MIGWKTPHSNQRTKSSGLIFVIVDVLLRVYESTNSVCAACISGGISGEKKPAISVSQYGMPEAVKSNPAGMERFNISQVDRISLDPEHPCRSLRSEIRGTSEESLPAGSHRNRAENLRKPKLCGTGDRHVNNGSLSQHKKRPWPDRCPVPFHPARCIKAVRLHITISDGLPPPFGCCGIRCVDVGTDHVFEVTEIGLAVRGSNEPSLLLQHCR